MKIYWGIKIARKKYMMKKNPWHKENLMRHWNCTCCKYTNKRKRKILDIERLTLLFLLLLSLQVVSFNGCLPVPCPRDHDVHCHLEEDAHLSVNFVGIVERVIDWEELDNPQGHSQYTCQQTSKGLLNKPVNIQSRKTQL